MIASDISLIARKIIVGLLVTFIPLAVVAGTLRLAGHFLQKTSVHSR